MRRLPRLRRELVESLTAAVSAYVVSALVEAAVIRSLRGPATRRDAVRR